MSLDQYHNQFPKLIFILLICLAFSPALLAETNNNTQTEMNHPSILSEFILDIKYLSFEPDFYFVIGGLIISPELFKSSFDSESSRYASMWATKSADSFFWAGGILGNGIFQVSSSIFLYSIGRFRNNSRLEAVGSDLLRAFAINGIITIGMKVTINRTRPNGGLYSYPSGHTSSAFTSAGVLYRDLGPGWGIPAFVVAVYIGISRLQENKHYLSDVIAGAILGTYISLKVTNRHKENNQISLKPALINGSPGAQFTVRF